MLNNLTPFNNIISYRAYTVIFHRLKDSNRELIEAEFDSKNF